MQAFWFQFRTAWQALARSLLASARDLIPVLLVVLGFQYLVIKQPLPDATHMILGFVLVLLGLTLLMRGLEIAFFPAGERLAVSFAQRGSLFLILVFSLALGFSTTVAEPALIAVSAKAAEIAVLGGFCEPEMADSYAFALRMTVATSVALALGLGVLRIIFGWSLILIIASGYLLVMALTPIAPAEIIGIAYDSGGVTTSTITVPLVTALGIGLASSIEGRHPVVDGFGLIALASLLPISGVLLFGVVWAWL